MGYTVGTKSFQKCLQGRHLCVRNTSKADKVETHFYSTNTEQLGAKAGVKSGSTAAPIQRLFTHVLQQADKDPGFRVEHRLCIISLYCLGEDNTEEEMRFPVLTDFLSKLLSLTLSHAVCCHTCRIE